MKSISFKKGHFRRKMKWGGCLLWVFLIVPWGCGHNDIPVELIGDWETSARHYEDCSLSISSETVAFRKGTNHSLLYKIDGVEIVLAGRVTYYVMHYESEDGKKYKLAFSLKKTPKGLEMQFSNQETLRWTRKVL